MRTLSAPAIRYPASRRQRQHGIALVMVLWLVVLLTIVAASFATHSRVETRMAGNLVEREKARLMAQSGLNRALMELMVKNADQRWLFNGEAHELQAPQGSLRIAIRNASGLVDLNRASREVLYNLFALVSDDPEHREQLVDALGDWRDSDDLRRLKGAEDSDYAAAGYDYGSADRDLESVDELGYVMGFDRDAVNKLRPYVTVYSDMGAVDYNFASETLTNLLKGEAPVDNTVAEALGKLDGGLVDIGQSDNGTDGIGGAPSRSYRISVEAVTAGGARSAIDVDIRMNNQTGKSPTILAWHDAF
ncbi:MAG: type II secretion system protein GspK [Candidatus Thiodiazotropha sp.]